MNRTIFLIDGFNLYHSLLDAQKFLRCVSTKWLNLKALCSSYLYLVGNDAQLSNIYYFSALATHYQNIDPGKILRHRLYIRCLDDSGIIIELGRFKSKSIICKKCGNKIVCHEEKETDVSMATKLLELSFTNSFDTAVLMTGDTDLTPVVKNVQQNFSHKNILFAFLYKRKNQELANLAPGSFSIGCNNIVKHQFPKLVILRDGTKIYKPDSW